MRRIALTVLLPSTDLYSQIPDYKLIAKNFGPLELPGNYINLDICFIHTDTTSCEHAAGEYYFNFQTAEGDGGVYAVKLYASGLASDAYVYRLAVNPSNPFESGSFVAAKKLVFLKQLYEK